MSDHQADYPIATMCRVLGVSSSGYHAWVKRRPSRRAETDAVLIAVDLNPLPRFIRRGAAIGSWSTARRCGDGHECRRELAVAARFDPSEKLIVWHG